MQSPWRIQELREASNSVRYWSEQLGSGWTVAGRDKPDAAAKLAGRGCRTDKIQVGWKTTGKTVKKTPFPSVKQACEERDTVGSGAEEEAWSGDSQCGKDPNNKQCDDEDKRGNEQRHAGEERVIPEAVYHSLIEEIQQEKFGAGLTALSYRAIRVPTNTDKAIQNLLHLCDGRLCEDEVLTNSEVIKRYIGKKKDQLLHEACVAKATRCTWAGKTVRWRSSGT